jgi:hypothetical protein
MTAVMDELASSARSARDGIFNTLDAVGRQSRAANAALVEHVRGLTIGYEPAQTAADRTEPERDTRFDPEDEWELPARSGDALTGSGPTASRAGQDDDEDFPQTWLR